MARVLFELSQSDYRSVAGPSLEELVAAETDLKTREARRIASLLKRGHLSFDEAEELHGQLVSLGFESVSLEFDADEARENADSAAAAVPAELAVLVKQEQLLLDLPGAIPSLTRCAELLEQARQFGESAERYERVCRIQPDTLVASKAQSLREYVDAISRGEAIIVLTDDFPLDAVAEVAGVLKRAVVGRYAIAHLDPVWCGETPIDLGLVRARYQEAGGKETPSSASCRNLYWIDGGRGEQRKTFVVERDEAPQGCRIGLAFPFTPGANVVSPVLYLDVPDCAVTAGGNDEPRPEDLALHNLHVREFNKQIPSDAELSAWVRKVSKLVRKTIGEIANQFRPDY